MNLDELPPPSLLLSDTTVRARKDHVCTSCRNPIPAGHIYRRRFGLIDGDPYAEKLCGDCEVYTCMADLIELPLALSQGLEFPAQPCECEAFALGPGGPRLPDHHRGGLLGEGPGEAGPCGATARYGVRLRHHNRCDGEVVQLLCERCWTCTQGWAYLIVPKFPPPSCGCRLAGADLVGPVMPL
jgi:hypothetical protein